MARIFLLGIISGFPWVLIGSALSLWLKEEGLSRTTIGWAGLIFGGVRRQLPVGAADRPSAGALADGTPGAAPRLDPCMQAVILGSLVLWSQLEPTVHLAAAVAVGLVIAIASATQDITIDALRIGAGGGVRRRVHGGGRRHCGGRLVDGIQARRRGGAEERRVLPDVGVESYWQATFLVLGVLVVACSVALALFVRRRPGSVASGGPGGNRRPHRLPSQPGGRVRPHHRAAGGHRDGPVHELLPSQRPGHRGGGAGLHLPVQDRRSVPGPHCRCCSTARSASPRRTSRSTPRAWGGSPPSPSRFWAVTSRSAPAWCGRCSFRGWPWRPRTCCSRRSPGRANQRPCLPTAVVVVDDLASAFATVTFVAFISMLVDRTYTASQYALLASVGTAGRTLFAALFREPWSTGWDGDWGSFFVITALMVMPSLGCLWAIRRRLAKRTGGWRGEIGVTVRRAVLYVAATDVSAQPWRQRSRSRAAPGPAPGRRPGVDSAPRERPVYRTLPSQADELGTFKGYLHTLHGALPWPFRVGARAADEPPSTFGGNSCRMRECQGTSLYADVGSLTIAWHGLAGRVVGGVQDDRPGCR